MLTIQEAASLVRTCPDCYGRMTPYTIETDGISHHVSFNCKQCGQERQEFHYVFIGHQNDQTWHHQFPHH